VCGKHSFQLRKDFLLMIPFSIISERGVLILFSHHDIMSATLILLSGAIHGGDTL
jgi:hypothetical protein